MNLYLENLLQSLKDNTAINDKVTYDLLMEALLKGLKGRERQILYLRIGQQKSLQECAKVLGLKSRERIRQIEKRALEKLEDYINGSIVISNNIRLD